jgi:hypothetical protein
MLIVTNVAAVEAVIAAKMPRPWKEIVLDVYPGATIDANGRAHAPYDGYECGLTGRQFKAGEFLPMSEPDDNYRVMGREVVMPSAIDTDGNIHEWTDLTRAQRAAVYAELINQTREHDAAKSKHIGNVGDKITLAAVVEMVKGFDGMYGTVWIHVLKDLAGNVLIYKGTKRLANKGSSINLAAKIKAHGDRDGVKQTIVERPKLV